MNNINIDELINKFYDFRAWLEDDLKNQDKINQEYCYLIDEKWIKDLQNCINKYYNSNNNFSFPPQNPKLINSFEELIDFIQKNQKFDLINHSLIDYKYGHLKRCKVLYLARSNKMIIDFYNQKDSNALLIDNPFNKNKIKDNSYVIINNNNQKKLYNDLLSIRYNFNNEIKSKYNKYVIPLEKYINKKNNAKNPLRKDILKIFINIFYYENTLNKNKLDIFNNNKKEYFYLIDPGWINKYKDHYHYNELYNILSKENYKMNYNYNDLDKHINDIIEKYIYEDIFDFDLKNNKFFNRNSNKMNLPLTTKEYYIMHSKIFDLIQKYESINKIIDLNPKELNIKNNNYLFIDYYDNNIFIGDIKNNLFTSKYVLSYNPKINLQTELEYLLSLTSIREYFKISNCNENESNIQKIMDGDNKIGELRILNINEPDYRKINSYDSINHINERNNFGLKSSKNPMEQNNYKKYFSNTEEIKYDLKEFGNEYKLKKTLE